jgi:hypothetical protein
MKHSITRHGRAVAGLVATMAVGAGAVAAATPASATVHETDRPKVTEQHFDFGTNWTLGAPRNGGYLDWDLVNGYTYPKLSGYLYLTDRECARVHVKYYDDDEGNHTYLGDRATGTYCAPGNAKTQWWVDVSSFFSTTVTHVHVRIEEQNASGDWVLVGEDIEDWDE